MDLIYNWNQEDSRMQSYMKIGEVTERHEAEEVEEKGKPFSSLMMGVSSKAV